MANKLYDEAHIQAIAEAIREKKGTTESYNVSEMADAIRSIPSYVSGVELTVTDDGEGNVVVGI